METALLEASIKQLKGWVIDFLACASTHSSLFPCKGSVWQSCWNSSVRAQTVKASVLRFLWRLLWIVTGTKTHPSCSISPIPSQLLVISSVRCGLRQSTLSVHWWCGFRLLVTNSDRVFITKYKVTEWALDLFTFILESDVFVVTPVLPQGCTEGLVCLDLTFKLVLMNLCGHLFY